MNDQAKDAADHWEAYWEEGRAHGEVFRGIGPASTMVVVAALLDPAWRIEIEAEALIDTASAFGG